MNFGKVWWLIMMQEAFGYSFPYKATTTEFSFLVSNSFITIIRVIKTDIWQELNKNKHVSL